MDTKVIRFKSKYLIILLKKEFILFYYKLFFINLFFFVISVVSIKLFEDYLTIINYLTLLSSSILFFLACIILQGRICRIARWKHCTHLLDILLNKIKWHQINTPNFHHAEISMEYCDKIAYYKLYISPTKFIIARCASTHCDVFDVLDLLNAIVFNNKENKYFLAWKTYKLVKNKIIGK